MSPLFALWLVSILLSAIALGIMVALIVARKISQERERTRAAERRRLLPLLLGAEPSAEPPSGIERAPDLLADLSIELVQMVRGTDKENFVASSSRLGVPERLRHRLDTGTPRKRLAAAEALADFSDDRSVKHLHEALDDPNADVRLSAALALASGGHAPPARLLVDKLGIGTTENSMLVVGLFRDIAATRRDDIRSLVEDAEVNPSVKAAAIDALSASGDYTLVPLIVELALKADSAGEELPRYLRALADFGHPAAAPAVEYGLSSSAWPVRAVAAQAVGRIRLSNLSERLVALLADPQWWVRFRAGEALASLGEEGQALLREAAAQQLEPASTAARLILAERGLAP